MDVSVHMKLWTQLYSDKQLKKLNEIAEKSKYTDLQINFSSTIQIGSYAVTFFPPVKKMNIENNDQLHFSTKDIFPNHSKMYTNLVYSSKFEIHEKNEEFFKLRIVPLQSEET